MATLRWEGDAIIAAAQAGAKVGVAKAALRTISKAKANLSGAVLNVRTGNLRRSVELDNSGGDSSFDFVNPNEPRAIVGSSVIYGYKHEIGGSIKPKKSKYLAIPLPGALTESGVVRGRFAPRSADSASTFGPKRRASLRDNPNLEFVRTRTGAGLLVNRQGKKTTPVYVLKRSVDIPKRPWLRPALEATREENIKTIREEVAKSLEKAGIK